MEYDFLFNQPHPETNEIACVAHFQKPQPLMPVINISAIACGGCYINSIYYLAIVPATHPSCIHIYAGKPNKFEHISTSCTFFNPITSVTGFIWNNEPFFCVSSKTVYIIDTQGSLYRALPYQAKYSFVFSEYQERRLLVDGKMYLLKNDWSISQTSLTITSSPYCPTSSGARDQLAAEGRNIPGCWGGSLVHWKDKYYYFCSDIFKRSTYNNYDCFCCENLKLDNQFQRRYLVIPNGGAANIFKGEYNTLFAAFVGETPHSTVYGKPALLPLSYTEEEFFRPIESYICETNPVNYLTPIDNINEIRDSFIFNGPDEWYYLTGTTKRPGGTYWKENNGIMLWRSKDLKKFECLGIVFDYFDTPASWQNQISTSRNCWAPEMIFWENTYWITYSTYPGCGLLKSSSGKPEGPYLDMGRVVNQGIDSGFFLENNTLYLVWQNGMIAPMRANGIAFANNPQLLLPEDGNQVGYEGAGLIKVHGKYVLYAAEWNGDVHVDGTYDMMYAVADNLTGPYSPRRLLIPHGGHGTLFWDKNNQLRYTIFGNDRTAPFRHSVGIGLLSISEENGVLTLTPVHEA